MAGRVGKCGYYVVMLAYVSERFPFARAVRRVEEAGARIEYMDEVERRIVADVPASRVEGLLSDLAKANALSSVALEVKSSCRHNAGLRVLRSVLRSLGFTQVPGGGAGRIYVVGVFQGRAVEVEADESRLRVKVGRRVAATPRPPIPPSLFLLDPEDVAGAYSALKSFIEEVRVRVRKAPGDGESPGRSGAQP
ncbi:hypothetical protein [Stetteria hydrogenophila]